MKDETKPKTELISETKPKTEVRGETKHKTQVKGEIKPKTQVKGKTKSKTQVNGETKPKTKVINEECELSGSEKAFHQVHKWMDPSYEDLPDHPIDHKDPVDQKLL